MDMHISEIVDDMVNAALEQTGDETTASTSNGQTGDETAGQPKKPRAKRRTPAEILAAKQAKEIIAAERAATAAQKAAARAAKGKGKATVEPAVDGQSAPAPANENNSPVNTTVNENSSTTNTNTGPALRLPPASETPIVLTPSAAPIDAPVATSIVRLLTKWEPNFGAFDNLTGDQLNADLCVVQEHHVGKSYVEHCMHIHMFKIQKRYKVKGFEFMKDWLASKNISVRNGNRYDNCGALYITLRNEYSIAFENMPLQATTATRMYAWMKTKQTDPSFLEINNIVTVWMQLASDHPPNQITEDMLEAVRAVMFPSVHVPTKTVSKKRKTANSGAENPSKKAAVAAPVKKTTAAEEAEDPTYDPNAPAVTNKVAIVTEPVAPKSGNDSGYESSASPSTSSSSPGRVSIYEDMCNTYKTFDQETKDSVDRKMFHYKRYARDEIDPILVRLLCREIELERELQEYKDKYDRRSIRSSSVPPSYGSSRKDDLITATIDLTVPQTSTDTDMTDKTDKTDETFADQLLLDLENTPIDDDIL